MTLNKSTNHWLRLKYTKIYSNPITELKIIPCQFDKEKRYLVISYITIVNKKARNRQWL
jgi:hypothetical protein